MISQLTNKVRELFYITHIDNLPSILDKGIYSHEKIEQEEISYTKIYDKEIVERRKDITTPDKRSLWSFANLYFNARNPMLYRIKCEKDVDDVALIGVSNSVLRLSGVFVSDGNAASSESSFLKPEKTILNKISKQTDRVYWNAYDGSKRKIMAECLVPDKIPLGFIISIYVPSFDAVKKVLNILGESLIGNRSVMCEPHLFFRNSREIELTPKLKLMVGDMFFSRAQTLTVSVNTIGVMGKGVASRAKWQFPDVFVIYHNACRRGYLKMGKPYLYQREHSSDFELADEPGSMEKCNATTWFLFFATKKHWRDRSDIEAIEKGLQWIVKNYKKGGMKSLALPALGCGLGRLNWRNVGPLLCKYMSKLDIPVSIYLPLEKEISETHLSKEFLLPEEQKQLS